MSKFCFEHVSKRLTLRPVMLLLAMIFLFQPAFAELQELEDDKLEQLHGKEGITIDLSYKLSIGEIAWQFRDQELTKDERQKSLTPPPPRIEYHQNGN
jgi:hypothetical protein